MDREDIIEELRSNEFFKEPKQKTISFFGSARLKENNQYYKIAVEISEYVSSFNYKVLSGGGFGLMEAFNKGAFKEGNSIGVTINLPNEQKSNNYINKEFNFNYFSIRKLAFYFNTDAFLVFPGGFGTLDELFEVLCLIQTNKLEKKPIILIGREFWRKLDNFIRDTLMLDNLISLEDIYLYKIVDTLEEVKEILKLK